MFDSATAAAAAAVRAASSVGCRSRTCLYPMQRNDLNISRQYIRWLSRQEEGSLSISTGRIGDALDSRPLQQRSFRRFDRSLVFAVIVSLGATTAAAAAATDRPTERPTDVDDAGDHDGYRLNSATPPFWCRSFGGRAAVGSAIATYTQTTISNPVARSIARPRRGSTRKHTRCWQSCCSWE